MCAAHVNNFSSNLVERVDFSDSIVVYKFFLINNVELKCSFVRCRNITGHDQMAPRRASHLGRFTLWRNGRGPKPGLMHVPGVADILLRQ